MTTINDDQMAPNASPGRVGVRRVNNLPVYIGVGMLGFFLLIIVLVAADRSAQQNSPVQTKEEIPVDSALKYAKGIVDAQQNGIIESKAVAAPLVMPEEPKAIVPGLSAPVAIIRPDNMDIPPKLPTSQTSQSLQQRGPDDIERDRLRTQKMQALEEAVKAKTSLTFTATHITNNGQPNTRKETENQLAAARQQIENSTSNNPTAAYKARLAMIQSSGFLPGGNGNSGDSSAAPQLLQTAAEGSPKNVAQFDKNGKGDRWQLDSQPDAPRSPYELRTGFVVPATLISGINSELPGQIIGQVAQSVYDTPTGKYLLIPQGSRLVGQYDSNVVYGQARILIAWQRIVFPDGKAMDIGSMPGADSAGYAGVKDQVNNHYVRLFSSAFLMSGITAGISLSQPDQTGTTAQTASSAMSEALGQQFGQVSAQLIAKNMNIAPTLEIRPGYRFNVMVTKDMTFSKPYQSFDYKL